MDDREPQTFLGCVVYFGLLALVSWALLGILGFFVYRVIVNW